MIMGTVFLGGRENIKSRSSFGRYIQRRFQNLFLCIIFICFEGLIFVDFSFFFCCCISDEQTDRPPNGWMDGCPRTHLFSARFLSNSFIIYLVLPQIFDVLDEFSALYISSSLLPFLASWCL